jgi:hypothetical protein
MSQQIEQDDIQNTWRNRAALTEEEAQRVLHLSRTQLWRLREEGKLRHCRQGVRIFYRPYHIDEYLDSIEAK